MISAIISVKDRPNDIVQRCIDSLKHLKEITEIIVVDYCSKVPVDVKCDKIIRFTDNILFNKPHALNLGIKQASNPYIMTVDCDMIFTKESMEPIPGLLREDCFIINTNVRRIEVKDIGNWEKSWSWYMDTHKAVNSRASSKANGGMQLFSKKWAEKVHGYDENLILLGGPDNDMYNRGVFDENVMTDLNSIIYHQEHKLKKEKILPKKDQEKALKIKLLKSRYLSDKFEAEEVVFKGTWGENIPNQDKFIKYWTDFKECVSVEKKMQDGLVKSIRGLVDESGVEVGRVDIKW